MLISVKEANETKTSRGNPMLQIVTADGEKMACFRPELFELLRAGAVADVQTEKRGDFSPNITSAFRPGVHQPHAGWRAATSPLTNRHKDRLWQSLYDLLASSYALSLFVVLIGSWFALSQ